MNKREAEPVVVVPVVRVVVVTTRHPTVPRDVDPTTATKHAVPARGRTPRVSLATTAVSSIPVLTPFIYVATHIIDSKLVRRFCANWFCTRIIGGRGVPRHIVYAVDAADELLRRSQWLQ